jgi:hypothetical protein
MESKSSIDKEIPKITKDWSSYHWTQYEVECYTHYKKVVVEVVPAASASLKLELPLLPWLLLLLLLLPPLPLPLLVVPPPPLRAGPNPFAPTPPVTLDFFPSPSWVPYLHQKTQKWDSQTIY